MLIFLFIARNYSVAQFGELILIITLTNIFSFVLDFGSSTLLVREIAVDNKKQPKLLINILVIKIVLVSLVIALFFVFLKFLGEKLDFHVFFIFSMGIFFESALMSLIKGFEGLERMKVSSLLMMLERIFIVIVLIFLSHENLLFRYAVSYFFSNFLTFTIAGVVLFLNKGFKSSKIAYDEIKYILNNSLIFFLFGVLSILYVRSDTFFLQKISGSEQLGLYRANLQLIESIYFIPMSLGISILPMFSRFFNDSLEKFKSFFKLIFSSLFLLGVLIAIFVLFNSEEIIKILYGNKYLSGSIILQFLSINIPIYFINSLIGNTLIAIKKEKIQFFSMLVGTIVKLILLYILTIYFGVIGTCISVIIGEVVILIIQSSGIKNLSIIGFRENRIYAAALIIIFAIHLFFQLHIIFSLIFTSITLIFLSRELIREYRLLS